MPRALITLQLLISILRLPEIALMTGFLLIGFFCAASDEATVSLSRFLLLSVAVFLHFSSIYFFNSYAGFSVDKQNIRIKHGMLAGIGKIHFLVMSIVFLLTSLFLYWCLNNMLPFMAFVSYMVWLVYSREYSGLKQVPFAGTAIHFFSQLLHFSMGWMTMSSFSYETLIVGIYFAFLFSSGHLNHELIDYGADKNTNVKTGAVTLGIEKTEFFYQMLSVITLVYICFVFFYDNNLSYLFVFIPASFLHMVFAFSLKNNSLLRRTVYRFTFLVSGLFFIYLNF